MQLYEQMKEKIISITHSQYSIKVLDILFVQPIFSASGFVKKSEIPRASAKRILNKLEESQIISKVIKGTGRMPSIYRFGKLIEISNK